MSTTSNKPVKFIGIFMMVAGLLMIVAGGVTWGLVQTQLKAEHITVAAVTPENPGRLAGKDVAGPFTAYAQATAIETNTRSRAPVARPTPRSGRTRLRSRTSSRLAVPATRISRTNADVKALAATRTTTMNGSFLRASLFTSVVSFGIAALVIGLGLLFILIGFALMKVASPSVVAVETAEPRAGAAPAKA